MKHVAIDLGGRESQVCVRDLLGNIVDERKHPTKSLESYLAKLEPSRVIVETSAEAFRVADAAIGKGHQVSVVPATLVKALGVGARGVKNDQRDARTLSEASCRMKLPSVHIPSTAARELKSICGGREILIQTRTRSINNVRGWLRTQLFRIRAGATSSFPDRVRGAVVAEQQQVPTHIERQLRVIEVLNAEIKEADRQLRDLAQASPICRRLMTIPGVGAVTAVRFLATIDQVERFATAHRLQSYLGMTPGERSSSERERRTGITKAGPSSLRWSLVQAAWSAWRWRPEDPMVQWARRIAERRGKNIAIVALARKIAGVMYALWRDATTYEPAKAARQM